MIDYRVVGLSPEVADEARRTLRSPGYGHPVHAEVATGYGPCRVCLRPFVEGEERRLLFTHDPFAGREPYPLPGPIFIHERVCAPPADPSRFPDELRFIPLTLNAYGPGRRVLGQQRLEDGTVEGAADGLFADPAVAYIHVRNTEAGCYIATLERA